MGAEYSSCSSFEDSAQLPRVAEPSPDLEVLRWYRELGGEILTIGSDAHRPGDIAYAFDRVPAMLAAAGFTAITCFEGRKPVFVDVS